MKLRTGEVRLDYMNKAFSYDAQDHEFNPGDVIVIETDYGLDMGLLMSEIKEKEIERRHLPIKKMLRVATEKDIEKQKTTSEKEKGASEVCVEEINKAKLSMKLVNARYSFDGSRISFCYTAENRVDFRELVKSLASRLRTRIELRQVGVRDEARLFGGYGPCGRKLCCSSFLRDFKSVSIKMAKEQGLPLNPLKISGICGRLFCCLKYEYDYYLAIKKIMPRPGAMIGEGDDRGKIVSLNVLKQSASVRSSSGGWVEIPVELDEENILAAIKEVDKMRARDNSNNNRNRQGKQRKKQGKNKKREKPEKQEEEARDSDSVQDSSPRDSKETDSDS